MCSDYMLDPHSHDSLWYSIQSSTTSVRKKECAEFLQRNWSSRSSRRHAHITFNICIPVAQTEADHVINLKSWMPFQSAATARASAMAAGCHLHRRELEDDAPPTPAYNLSRKRNCIVAKQKYLKYL